MLKIKNQKSTPGRKCTLKIKNDRRGVAALLTIIVVGAAALLMAYSASILGLGDLDMGYTAQKGKQAGSWADACTEEALHRFRLDANYSGETLSLGEKSCIISVISNGNDRVIAVVASDGDFNKSLQSEITINSGVVTVNSWNEI